MADTSIANAVIHITFDGEGEVSIGAGEFFVNPTSGDSMMLDDARLDLIRRVMNAQADAEAAE